MHEAQLAALVVAVDQIEETIPDGQMIARIQQALDSLRAIADAVPSSIVVISCLEDVFDAIKPKLSRSLVDRLERDPAPVRLTSQRESDEIEQMLAVRLEHLFSGFDVPWREDQPLFPFTSDQIAAVTKLRTRDCLGKFREYHAACIEARQLLSPAASREAARAPAPPPVASPDVSHAWNRALAASIALPDEEPAILDVIEEGLRGAALEVGQELALHRGKSGILFAESKSFGKRAIAICNKGAQRGGLGKQLESLRQEAAGVMPMALRSSDWKFGKKTKATDQIGEFVNAGGRTLVLQENELRAIAAARSLVGDPRFSTWRKEEQPLASLPCMRELMDLDRVHAAPAAPEVPRRVSRETLVSAASLRARSSHSIRRSSGSAR